MTLRRKPLAGQLSLFPEPKPREIWLFPVPANRERRLRDERIRAIKALAAGWRRMV